MAITRRMAAFAAIKVVQIVALGLLYTLIPITQFSILSQWTVFSERVTYGVGFFVCYVPTYGI